MNSSGGATDLPAGPRQGQRRAQAALKRHGGDGFTCVYPVLGYTGYGDGVGTDLTAFGSDQMRADWEANRAELLAFWKSGKTTADVFPDALPWLHLWGYANTPPWAARHLDDGRTGDA
jgi:hypothetical protein